MDGTSFTIDIPVTGADAASAAAAVVDKLALSLDSAAASAAAAADRLAAGQASYNSAEAAANSAAKALERIGIAADAQQGKIEAALATGDVSGADRAAAKLQALIEKQATAATRAQQTAAALATEAAALDRLKTAASAAGAEEQRLSTAHEQAAKAAAQAAKASAQAEQTARGSGKVNEAAEALGKLGGPLGSLGQRFLAPIEGAQKLYGSLGDKAPLVVGAVGVAAVAAAVVLVTAAVAAGVAKFAQWAVGLADAARNQGLLAAGIAGTVAGGEALNAKIGELQKRVPIASDELLRMAGDLKKTGLEGKALEGALEDAAVKAAKLKFGPEFGKAMLSLDVQSRRLKDNVASIFSGLKIEKLLESFSRFVELFDATQVTGQVIKTLFEELFQPAVNGAATLTDAVTAAFIQVEIWALKALIAIKPYGSILAEVGQAIAIVIGLGLGTFIAGLAVAFVTAQAAVAVFAAGMYAVGAGFQWVYNTANQFHAYLKSINWGELGSAIIDGLVNGLAAGGAKFVGAVQGVAQSGINAAKSVLGIKSPSRVFAEIGGYTAEGMAMGVDSGKADVQASVESLVEPPKVEPSGGKPSEGKASAKSGIHLENVTFHLNGIKGAKEAEEGIRSLLLKLIEGDLASLGTEVPSA